MKLSVRTIAGFLYLMAAIYVSGIWYILLYTSNPPGVTSIDNLKYFLNEQPNLILFRLMFALPFICLVIAAVFISKWSGNRVVAFSLFGVGVLIAAVACAYGSTLAILLTMPLWHSFLNCKQYLAKI